MPESMDGAASEFLAKQGIEPSRIDWLLSRNSDVSYWKGLLGEFGDLGGNCCPNGTRVRTPWIPPPEGWSTPEAAEAWRQRNTGATEGDLEESSEEY
mmetsp:Transcript_77370/g.136501  ORF Transcript_77370/g.136501 Transcript_77370/m.136501 type:complete len:97 (-) Transcript_77370:19-309(-)